MIRYKYKNNKEKFDLLVTDLFLFDWKNFLIFYK